MRTIFRDNYTPELNQYHERIIVDEAQKKVWLFDCDGVFTDITKIFVANEKGQSEEYAVSQKLFTDETTKLADDIDYEAAARSAADIELGEAIDKETSNREDADTDLQNQIDLIKAASDVVDVVGTHADLEAYDTSKLNDNDIVKVLEDETHDGDITYYRWNTSTSAFTFVGALSAYYSKGETDTLLAGKQDTLTAGSNITISNNVISADKDDTTLYAKHPAGYTDRFNLYYEDTFTTMVTRTEMLDMLRAGNVQITYTPRAGVTWTQSICDVLEYGDSTPHAIWFSSSSYDVSNPSFISFRWLDGDDYVNYYNFNVYSYHDFTGTDGTSYGSHGLVPAPVPSDAGKFLKSDGAWEDLPSANNVNSTDWSNLWQ